jgi:hypothetical protein
LKHVIMPRDLLLNGLPAMSAVATFLRQLLLR